MSTKTYYAKIGVFVIATVGLLVAGVVVLSVSGMGRDALLLETYLDESVQGLSVGSPVRRRGVQIGSVEEITFVAREYGHTCEEATGSHLVMIIMSIDRADMPTATTKRGMRAQLQEQIDRGLRLKLATQGITGVCYIEADFIDPKRYPPPELAWQPERLHIPAMPSTLISFTQSIDRILVNLERIDFASLTDALRRTAEELGKAIADARTGEARQELVALAKDLRRAVRLATALIDKTKADPGVTVTMDLAGVMKSADRTLKSLGREIDNADVAAVRKDLVGLVAEARKTNQSVKTLVDESKSQLRAADIPKAIARFNQTMKRLERLATGQQSDVEAILDNLRQVSANLLKLSELAEKYPSHLLFGAPPPRKEKK